MVTGLDADASPVMVNGLNSIDNHVEGHLLDSCRVTLNHRQIVGKIEGQFNAGFAHGGLGQTQGGGHGCVDVDRGLVAQLRTARKISKILDDLGNPIRGHRHVIDQGL